MKKRLLLATSLLLLSAVLLSTASFAWFSMNTNVKASGFKIEAYSDALFLEISDAADGVYGPEVDLSEMDEAALRLTTLGRLTSGAFTITESEITDGRRYSSADPDMQGSHFYMRVKTDPVRNDTYEGDNFICIDEKLRDASSVAGYYNFSAGEIAFTVVTSNEAVFDGTETYYKRVGNAYIPQTLDSDGDLTENELPLGAHLRGFYKVELGTAEGADARYDGTSLYYNIDNNGRIAPVGSLTLGTSLNGYYEIEEGPTVLSADGESKYYFKNERGDYVSIGVPKAGEDLSDYFYFARAYSSKTDEVQEGNTLNVLKQEHLDNYYLHDTLYLRMRSRDKDGENLRISAVNIAGDDSLTEAIRVLFVAKNEEGEVSRAFYNHRTGEITHLDGEVLFERVIGQAGEIVTLDVYIYFDGTDTAARSQDAVFSGQTVSFELDVDRPYYAP